MFTAPCLLALASISISGGGDAPLSAAELELGLARGPGVYLVLDPSRDTLEVKARGLVLERLPLTAATLAGYRRPFADPPPPVELPAVWTVTEDAAARTRRVVAPESLVPYSADAPPPLPAGSGEEAEVPAAYLVSLDRGFVLAVGQRLRGTGLGGRLADGWRRVRGAQEPPPRVLAVALAAEDARRLLPLLRPGMRILVVPDDPNPASRGGER